MTVVVTFGSFDCFHYGHYAILKRASALGDTLKVGLSSDTLHKGKKDRKAVYSYEQRKEILADLRFVDMVFEECSLEQKREYLLQHKADFLVMGDDWQGEFDMFSDICQVVYLPRTQDVSTTLILDAIKTKKGDTV